MRFGKQDILLGLLFVGCCGLAAWCFCNGEASGLEVLAFVTSAMAVCLEVKENVWNWPWGIIGGAAYVGVCYQASMFGNAALNVFFAVEGFAGWYWWLKGGRWSRQGASTTPPKAARLNITNVSLAQGALLIVLTVLATWAANWLLRNEAPTPIDVFLDAFTTIASIVGEYMLARKYFQNWHVWIVVNLVSVPMYLHQQINHKPLVLTAVLYGVFAVMSVLGLLEWRILRRRQDAPA
jgi:nicotinamide mononucleotide transporter